ncbi:hypothetical protein Efla_007450 [Eimeria flavescens]
MHRTGLLYLLSPFATYEGATGEDATNTFERLSTAELLHGNVLEAAIEEYDSKLVQFTEFFASPIQPRVLNPRGAIIRTNARSGLSSPSQQGSLFLTVFVSLVCAAGVVPFCYFGAYGYAAGSFTLSAFYGVLPELALALVCLSVGVSRFLLSSSTCQKPRLAARQSSGILIMRVHPGIGFANHYYYVLRLLYYLFLLLGAGFLYLSLPPYVKNVEPMGLEERERAKWEKLFCLLTPDEREL